MESIWRMTAKLPKSESLSGNIETEAAVIGGGMAGIAIAYKLKERGIKTVVLEADRIGSGQTGNTTAKITLQHGLIYQTLINKLGPEKAKLYAKANKAAITEYKKLVETLSIECGFRECASYLYSRKEEDALREEEAAALTLGIIQEFTTQTELPFSVKGALRCGDQAVFHPLLFLKALAETLTIYENTRVISVIKNKITTNQGEVTAKHIVFASHYPFIDKPGFYFMRMHQERSYALALKHAGQMDHIYYGIDQGDHSFRKSGEYLILGGEKHRTGENRTGGCYDRLRKAAATYYPDACVETAWSAQDCIPLDNVPYIGSYASSEPDWYVATGFQKWGMTTSMVAATIISDMITEGGSSYEEVFTPKRFHLQASAAHLWEDGVASVKGLTKGLIAGARASIEELPPGHGGIVEYDGERVGVYKEEDGTCHIVSARCPHLGCLLEWNPDELSFDCPCHGSRFGYDGKLLNNPAGEDLRHA